MSESASKARASGELRLGTSPIAMCMMGSCGSWVLGGNMFARQRGRHFWRVLAGSHDLQRADCEDVKGTREGLCYFVLFPMDDDGLVAVRRAWNGKSPCAQLLRSEGTRLRGDMDGCDSRGLAGVFLRDMFFVRIAGARSRMDNDVQDASRHQTCILQGPEEAANRSSRGLHRRDRCGAGCTSERGGVSCGQGEGRYSFENKHGSTATHSQSAVPKLPAFSPAPRAVAYIASWRELVGVCCHHCHHCNP